VTNTLLGKSGVLAQWFQRHALVTVLQGLARAARKLLHAAVAPSARAASEGLLSALGKEGHEGTRAAALSALGEWLALVDSLPAAALGDLRKGLSGGSKDPPLPYLLATREALGGHNGALKAPLAELAEPLQRLVRDGARKAGQTNLEALLALHVLTELGAAEAGDLSGYLTDKGSWLFAPALLDALSAPANAPAAVSLARVVFAGTRSLGVDRVIVGGVGGEGAVEEGLGVRHVQPAALALLEVLLHPVKEVRAEAEAVLKAVVREDPAATHAMLKASWVKVHQVRICAS
jgi:hypothetical protein